MFKGTSPSCTAGQPACCASQLVPRLSGDEPNSWHPARVHLSMLAVSVSPGCDIDSRLFAVVKHAASREPIASHSVVVFLLALGLQSLGSASTCGSCSIQVQEVVLTRRRVESCESTRSLNGFTAVEHAESCALGRVSLAAAPHRGPGRLYRLILLNTVIQKC